jgi:hypothetical protein
VEAGGIATVRAEGVVTVPASGAAATGGAGAADGGDVTGDTGGFATDPTLGLPARVKCRTWPVRFAARRQPSVTVASHVTNTPNHPIP